MSDEDEEFGTVDDAIAIKLLTKSLQKNRKLNINEKQTIEYELWVQKSGKWKKYSDLTKQDHHILTKYGAWGIKYNKILNKYGYNINSEMNILNMPHSGKHPPEYHKEMYDRLLKIDNAASPNGIPNKALFEKLFKKDIGVFLNEHPEIINYYYKFVPKQ